MTRVICISDTHNLGSKLKVPDGDILIHAGDMTSRGSLNEVEREVDWLKSLPHKHKVLIAGNHDWAFQRTPAAAQALCNEGVTYLQDGEVTCEGFRIWGAPWQPLFYNWAFNLRRGAQIKAKWDLIPVGIDILVTHGPPQYILDQTMSKEQVGCFDLAAAIRRVQPKLHVFGHIHEGYGQTRKGNTIFVNASSCNRFYDPIHEPIVIDLN